MIVLPIRTESPIRRTPRVNYALIGINMAIYLLLNANLLDLRPFAQAADPMALRSTEPAFYQFLTYQFRHGDGWHLLGNMLFLWVFGNSVNSKMGDWKYLLFYLAGGALSGWGQLVLGTGDFALVGASGAIAAVTTAYLVLFPRSRVTVLLWFFIFIHFFQMPAMVIIGVKIIIWDNIIAPNFGDQGPVAHGAHLVGYFVGFVGAMTMLLTRVLPRDQFDLLALWKRWHRRRAYASTMATVEPAAPALAEKVVRVSPVDQRQQEEDQRRHDEIRELRTQIASHLSRGEPTEATRLYEQLVVRDPKQCLPEHLQVTAARAFYDSGRFPQAAAAFDRFLERYPYSREVDEIRLLLGIIYARDLRQYESADRHLTAVVGRLDDSKRRAQCLSWLGDVRGALGRPAPDANV